MIHLQDVFSFNSWFSFDSGLQVDGVRSQESSQVLLIVRFQSNDVVVTAVLQTARTTLAISVVLRIILLAIVLLAVTKLVELAVTIDHVAIALHDSGVTEISEPLSIKLWLLNRVHRIT